MTAMYELFFALSVLALAVTMSSRARYWARMVTFFFVVQLVAVVMLPVAAFSPKNPRNFLYGSKLFHLASPLFRINWKVEGKENVKDKAYIIVANHQSSIDAMGIVMNYETFHPVVMVMKAELKYALSFGLYCYLSGVVFLDRGSEKGRRALEEGFEEAKKMKKSMLIFPEGTRNRTREKLLPFKKGAFHMAVQAQIPILPIVFSDYSSFYSREEQRFDAGSATLTILPEINTDGLSKADVNDLCERTRRLMMEKIVKHAPMKSKCD